MAGLDPDLAGRRQDGDGLAATLTLPEAPDPRAPGSDDGDRGYLVVIEAGSSAEVKLPAAGTLVLGRAPDVEVPLRSQVVSRRHARLQVGADGVYIEDLGSHNGTRRNGEPLTATAPQLLRSGDVVTLCDVALVYYGPSRGAPSAAQSTTTSALGPPLALTDPLRFRHSLETECERAAQALRPLALVVLLAPQLGLAPQQGKPGPRGRPLLEAVLGRTLRRMDSAAPGGRDEIWILLPDRDEEEAAATASRLVAELGEQDAELRPVLRAGVAATAVDGFDADALLGGARAGAEVAPPGQVRTAADAVSTLRVGDGTVLLADPAMVRLYSLIERLAPSELPVLILGETGTGKELVAQALHERSPRRAARLVSINCAALPESLAESELFGHERGAFTGATTSKPGLLEAASGGTVFLDELGELSLSVQAKLLRVLETRRMVRVGDTRERPVDIRLVAATHRRLRDEAEQGRFRQDLYFRLSSAVLVLPPLRDRKRELPLLARAFLREACQKLGKPELSLSGAALECMGRYGWPGNVRELKNAMQFAAATSTDPVLSPWHLPEEIGTAVPSLAAAIPAHAAASLADIAAALLRLQVPDKLAAIEAALVAAALKLSAGNKSQAARLLGVHRKVVERRTDKR
ncbi:MAG: sigma 54-interacting transcriptional regulator [Polyangia bacterium]